MKPRDETPTGDRTGVPKSGRLRAIFGNVLAPGSEPAGEQDRRDHWRLAYGLLPFVWPEDRPDLRRRVVWAAIILVIAKIITVLVPVFFKEATDLLAEQSTSTGGAIAVGVAMWASAMVVAYGIGRVAMAVLTQVRDVLFTAVGQHAVRTLNNRTFRHLHRLSLRFHLERKTGGVSRVIERATRAIELIMRMGVLNLLPTLLEFVLIAGVLLYFFNWI